MSAGGTMSRIVIVGGGAAGLAIAETVRSEGFRGDLTLVGDEQHLPYDRPPLSKQVLSGAWGADRVVLRDSSHLDRLGLTLLRGTPAAGLDVDAREVVLADESRIGYDALAVTTGVSPRRLPGTEGLRGVHVLRSLDHALALRDDLTPSAQLVIVGAGVLGCEVAAVARGLGVGVTLVDPLPLPMSRIVGGEVSHLIAELHREHGVECCLGVGVRGLQETDGNVVGVELVDGRLLAADVVLVAIGSDPTIDWLRGSTVGIGGRPSDEGAGGVLCAPDGRAADGIYAAGDVAAWWSQDTRSHRRVEHRLNAGEQGSIVAKSMLGDSTDPVPAVPYFWSDQYALKIQCYGLPMPDDEFEVVEGSLATRKFIGIHVREGAVAAVVGVGLPRQLRDWRTKVGQPMRAASA
ncbi:MAG: NAD(P)/FAD-dependent oxidoreductase [Hyphomicrobiales bacterium]|nr:MAG: NAD(P)/FAD-dependent oxidoreductase [Hyphomicrobiales bacterium]